MDFLALCQRTASECSTSLTGPSDTTTQVGRLNQIVNWVNTAWMDVQTRRNNWRFMVGSFDVNTVAGTNSYSLTDCGITDFREWRRDQFRIYLTSAGVDTEGGLCWQEYDDWYHRFNIGAQSDSFPGWVAQDHDSSLLLGPAPGGIYTVSGEYMKAATEMSGDAAEPTMPEEYHMAIVYRAMMKYGRYNGANEVYTDGANEYKRMMREMERTQRLPDLKAGPLA
jgi:hypothetical protein